MGRNKAFLPIENRTLIEWIVGTLHPIADPLSIIANDPESYRFLNLPIYSDIRQGCGALGGLHTALTVSPTDPCLVVACDLIFLNPDFLRYLIDAVQGYDAAVPLSRDGYQPLCAVYSQTCITPIEQQLAERELKIVNFYAKIRVNLICPEIIDRYDPEGRMFWNINTPEDYDRAVRVFTSATQS
jgi:molybdopterin-guanine dinucleotide biosynthesis protein A